MANTIYTVAKYTNAFEALRCIATLRMAYSLHCFTQLVEIRNSILWPQSNNAKSVSSYFTFRTVQLFLDTDSSITLLKTSAVSSSWYVGNLHLHLYKEVIFSIKILSFTLQIDKGCWYCTLFWLQVRENPFDARGYGKKGSTWLSCLRYRRIPESKIVFWR